jgi:uncharacterized protein (DUF1786 family)
MPTNIIAHVRRNVVAYLALFIALGGTSYATSAKQHLKATARVPAAFVTSPDPQQEIADGVFEAVRFEKEVFDIGGMHSPGDNDSRVVAPRTGTYVVQATAIFAGDPCGGGHAAIIQRHMANGNTFNLDHTNATTICSEPHRLHAGAVARLRAGEYLELIVLERSAKTQKVGGTMSVAYLGN